MLSIKNETEYVSLNVNDKKKTNTLRSKMPKYMSKLRTEKGIAWRYIKGWLDEGFDVTIRPDNTIELEKSVKHKIKKSKL